MTGAAMLAAAFVAGGARYAIGTGDGGPGRGGSAEPASTTVVAGPPDTTVTAIDSPDASAEQASPFGTAAVADCEEKSAELERREESDSIDWDSIEAELVDIDSIDEDSIELTLSGIDGRVAAPGERFVPERLGQSLDLATVPDRDLVDAVDLCYVNGVLEAEHDPEFED